MISWYERTLATGLWSSVQTASVTIAMSQPCTCTQPTNQEEWEWTKYENNYRGQAILVGMKE